MSDSAATPDPAAATIARQADLLPNQAAEMNLRVLLGFLRAGRVLDHGSSVLLLAGLLAWMYQPVGPGAPALAGALLAGLLAKYLAWRVALDAEFFALLLAQPGRVAAFDYSLAAFLGRPAPAETRGLASRWQGARRLVGRQAAIIVVQILLLGTALAWAALSQL
ncbi:MAG: hypothetical protein M3Y54_05650 [Bacteroidota bacterium]|nr:hypothetical protein [Bacteroidota bacterium]